jgi:FkbH-like protein
MNADLHAATIQRRGHIKCLVWDLDNTLWQGTLSEGDTLTVRPEVRALIETLDQRGILQSIASKNDPEPALAQLLALGLEHYFLYPQIGWGPKSEALGRIAQFINIGIDSLAFVDDQAYERDEVAFTHHQVLCLDASRLDEIADMPALIPRFITDESASRRLMYQQDAERQRVEETYAGPKEDFLAALDMVFTVTHADEKDLQRLEELTARTNQLNTTGRIYSSAELDAFRHSPSHALLVAALDDRYGSYGKIGMALIETGVSAWNIKLLLMSCRVISRGVGMGLLGHIMRAARAHGVTLNSEMIPNERNRLMYATYRFAGFQQVATHEGLEILRANLDTPPRIPDYVRFHCDVDTILPLTAPRERHRHSRHPNEAVAQP